MNAVKSPTDRTVNRIALLMVLSACCFILAGMGVPFAFRDTGALAAQLAVAALGAVGLGLAALAFSLRDRLWSSKDR